MDLIAKQQVDNGQCSIAVRAADGQFVTVSGRTIAPLATLSEDMPELFRGAFVADKVIGKGAASLLASLGVAEVYGKLMSEPGKRMLEENGVACSWELLVPEIENHDRSGLCPLETVVAPLTGMQECADAVRAFAQRLRNK